MLSVRDIVARVECAALVSLCCALAPVSAHAAEWGLVKTAFPVDVAADAGEFADAISAFDDGRRFEWSMYQITRDGKPWQTLRYPITAGQGAYLLRRAIRKGGTASDLAAIMDDLEHETGKPEDARDWLMEEAQAHSTQTARWTRMIRKLFGTRGAMDRDRWQVFTAKGYAEALECSFLLVVDRKASRALYFERSSRV